jgi:hypothetical protein
MDGTIIVRGNFTQPATAVSKTIVFRPGVNWIDVVNYTTNERYYFQTNMVTGKKVTAAGTMSDADADAFVVIDYSDPSIFITGPVNTTSSSDVPNPVVATAASIAIGDVVRVVSRAGGAAQFGVYGVDCFVGAINAGVDCTLLNADNVFAAAPGIAGGTGSIYKINISSRFYPANRIVTKMSQAGGVITVGTSAPHGMTVGQQVRFKLPSTVNAGYVAKLDSNSSNNFATFTVASVITNANGAQFPSVAFTLTANGAGLAANMGYPTSAQVAAGSQLPEMIPFGQDTAYSVSQNANILADATVNQGFIGIRLKSGAFQPAGAANEVVFWKVGACFNSEEYA